MVNQSHSPLNIFARRLREARLRVGLSQMSLGVAAGIDEFSASPRINQYERGKHVPDLDTARRLAAVVGVPLAYFYCDEDELAGWLQVYQKLDQSQRKRVTAALGMGEYHGSAGKPE